MIVFDPGEARRPKAPIPYAGGLNGVAAVDRLALAISKPRFDRAFAVRNASRTQPNEARTGAVTAMAEKGGFADAEPVAELALGEKLICFAGGHLRLLKKLSRIYHTLI
jgi:hypothetical protein